MKRLWAPWRMDFISSVHKKKKGCIFCDLPKQGLGPQTLVLHEGNKAFVILNRFPYTNGHLMVVPKRHLSDFTRLSSQEHQELGELVSLSLKILKKSFYPQGFNVGLNLGLEAGAGIKDHLHYHVVPRWAGDHNFMPVLGDVRVMPEYLEKTYQKLAVLFHKNSRG